MSTLGLPHLYYVKQHYADYGSYATEQATEYATEHLQYRRDIKQNSILDLLIEQVTEWAPAISTCLL